MAIGKRDCERIARELRDVRPEDNDAQWYGWWLGVTATANALHDRMGLDVNGNRRFHRDRFMDAAGARGRPAQITL